MFKPKYGVYKSISGLKKDNSSEEKILSYKHLCVYFQLKDYTRDKKKETIFDKVFKRSLSAFHKEMQATISVEKQVRLYISTLFHMQFQMQHMYNGEQIYVYQLFGFL